MPYLHVSLQPQCLLQVTLRTCIHDSIPRGRYAVMAPLQRFVLFIYLALSCNVLSARHFRLKPHWLQAPWHVIFFCKNHLYSTLEVTEEHGIGKQQKPYSNGSGQMKAAEPECCGAYLNSYLFPLPNTGLCYIDGEAGDVPYADTDTNSH